MAARVPTACPAVPAATPISSTRPGVAPELVGEGALDRVLASVTYVLAANSDVEVLETTSQFERRPST